MGSNINVSLTNHAKERYAERIMGKESKGDIGVFIAQNNEKIQSDVSDMVNYGELIFEGKQTDGKDVKVYNKNTWVILLDIKTNAVITLYKIELGAGYELDKMYVEKMLEQVDKYKEEEREAKEQVDSDNKTYKDIIDDLEKQIVDYRKSIKEMEALVANYKETIQGSGARLVAVKNDIASIMNKLLSKKHF